jgi:hypothetical protein
VTACEERVDVMVVTARQSPYFHTIRGVRKGTYRRCDGGSRRCSSLCQQAGLVSMGPWRIGGDDDPSQCLQAYGDALQPDEDRRPAWRRSATRKRPGKPPHRTTPGTRNGRPSTDRIARDEAALRSILPARPTTARSAISPSPTVAA